MTKLPLLSALAAAQSLDGIPNREELLKAAEAVRADSPIKFKRAKRALATALSDGREDQLAEDLRDLCREIIGRISDRGGVLPSDDGKLAHVHIRIESRRKSAYVRAAQASGESLSEWITRHCDREAGYQP